MRVLDPTRMSNIGSGLRGYIRTTSSGQRSISRALTGVVDNGPKQIAASCSHERVVGDLKRHRCHKTAIIGGRLPCRGSKDKESKAEEAAQKRNQRPEQKGDPVHCQFATKQDVLIACWMRIDFPADRMDKAPVVYPRSAQ